jgi:hypothetical protein
MLPFTTFAVHFSWSVCHLTLITAVEEALYKQVIEYIRLLDRQRTILLVQHQGTKLEKKD